MNKYLDLENFNYDTTDLFGHYAEIEMELYGEKGNQIHLFKIISSCGQSNFYNDVPFNEHTKPAYLHKELIDIAKVVECGISEEKVYRVPLKDIKIIANEADKLKEKLEEIDKINFPIMYQRSDIKEKTI